MMYSAISELPSQVRNALDDDDQKVWMESYNACDPKSDEEVKEARKTAWRACKDLPSSFSFRIRASVDDIDKDNDIVDMDTIKQHIDAYIDRGGNVQWEHGSYNVGTVWDWEPAEDHGRDAVDVWGNLYRGDFVYDSMRKMFVNGRNSMSIAGAGTPPKYQCDERGCYVRRGLRQMMEISLCVSPSNRYCTLQWYNKDAAIAKSASEDMIRLAVDSYEIHRDYDTCPVLSLKKRLADAGFKDLHASDRGVIMKMSREEFDNRRDLMRRCGLCAEWDCGEAILNDMDYAIEKAYKHGIENRLLLKDGTVTVNATVDYLRDLYRKGMLVRFEDRFYLTRPGEYVLDSKGCNI